MDEMVPQNCRFDLQTSHFKTMKANVLQFPNACERWAIQYVPMPRWVWMPDDYWAFCLQIILSCVSEHKSFITSETLHCWEGTSIKQTSVVLLHMCISIPSITSGFYSILCPIYIALRLLLNSYDDDLRLVNTYVADWVWYSVVKSHGLSCHTWRPESPQICKRNGKMCLRMFTQICTCHPEMSLFLQNLHSSVSSHNTRMTMLPTAMLKKSKNRYEIHAWSPQVICSYSYEV